MYNYINEKKQRCPDLEKAFIDGLKQIQNGISLMTLTFDKTQQKARNNQVLHVSDLGYTLEDSCPRQLFLKLHNAEKQELHYSKKLMFTHAELIHLEAVKLIALGLDKYWTIASVEESVEGYGLVGRLDMSLRGANGEVVIVDFKTARGGSFKYLDRNGPKDAHIKQVNGYVHIKNADYAVLLYLDREGQNGIRQFSVETCSEENLISDVAYLETAMQYKPERLKPKLKIRENKGDNSIYLKPRWNCGYCDYYQTSCEGDLSPEKRNIGGIVAKENEQGIYAYKDKYAELMPLLEELMV